MPGALVHSRPLEASRPRILVVEDEPPALQAITRVLGEAGFDVSAAEDGARALRLLDDEAPFDVVLSDISMPGMDGIALLNAVREHDLDVPVILMTGIPGVESAADAMRYGAFDYLIKPLDLEKLENRSVEP